MTSQPTHALLLYGTWLHAAANDGTRVWGLVAGEPARVVQSSRDEGFTAETPLMPVSDAPAPVLDWSARHAPAVVTRTDHCWARWLGTTARPADEIGFRGVDLRLPDPLGGVLLAIPTIDNVPLEFVDPPFRPGAGFVEEPVWPLGRRALSVNDPIVPLPGPHDAATAAFRARLGALFDGLRAHSIFGCDLHAQGWMPSESVDIAAARVSSELRAQWGWADEAPMSLCWCDIEQALASMREDLADDLYGSNGMDEEWWDRVDIRRAVAPAAVTVTSVYYDGRDDADRARIARCIVDAAPAAGLVARWDGNITRAVAVSWEEV